MSLKRNAVANYLGQGWTALMGLAFVPVYIRYLGIESWGLIGFMSVLQAWLTLLDMGLTPTLSREMARYQGGAHSAQSIRDLLRTLEFVYGGVAIVVIAAVGLAAPWLASHWFKASSIPAATLSQAITMMGLVLAARMAEQVYRGAILGLQSQIWLNGATAVLASLRWAGAAAAIVWGGVGLQGFFLWQGMVSLASVVVLSRHTYHLLPTASRRAHFDTMALVAVRRFAGGMAVTTLLSLLLTQVDKLLLSRLVSLEAFGYYSLAASAAAALSFLISPVVTAVGPRMTELVTAQEHAQVTETYHRASQWLAVMLVPPALVLAAFAEPLLWVWTLNPEVAQRAAPLLSVMAVGTLLNGLMNVPYTAQLAHGWPGLAVRTNIVAVLALVPAILWAVPRYGAIAAAWVWVTLNLGLLLIAIPAMHRHLFKGQMARWYREAVLMPLGAGMLAVVAMRCVLPQSADWLFEVMLLVATGCVVTIAVLVSTPAPRHFVLNLFQTRTGNAHD